MFHYISYVYWQNHVKLERKLQLLYVLLIAATVSKF